MQAMPAASAVVLPFAATKETVSGRKGGYRSAHFSKIALANPSGFVVLIRKDHGRLA
ncbi:hypothetical protein [Candidatus Accumulibacter sp. ACC012]|uniref:hypothetical protein n=1 Tax=Candidatus Accumulibacter sp. ACC012 TaxID=2823332 RepID=UPI0025BC27C6|nr:hypothetical protein [Candidatus Accumulibacter sp. ACC012]